MRLGRGAVVVVELDPTVGHEQRGVRPCIVVSNPDVISDQHFPLVCVLPVTATPGEGLLYPQLGPGKSGLAKKSFALIDHLRSVDKRRVRSVFGELTAEEIAAIDEGLRCSSAWATGFVMWMRQPYGNQLTSACDPVSQIIGWADQRPRVRAVATPQRGIKPARFFTTRRAGQGA